MSIKKLGPNHWCIKISVRVPGKTHPVSKQETFTGTKVEADIRSAQLIAEIRDNKSSSLTHTQVKNFAGLLKPYSENLKVQGKLSKFHENKIDFLEKELGHISIEEFPDRFEIFIRIYRNTPTIHGKVRGSASANRLIEITKAAYNHGIKLDIIEKNPITNTRYAKSEEKARDRYLNEDERTRLINSICEHRPYLLPIIQYMLNVPCRKSELVTAGREQYNQFSNTIYIPDSKNGLPINKPVPPIMTIYFKNLPKDCPYLFYQIDKYRNYHSLGDFKKAWAYCLKKAKLQNVRIHDLRHISATDLYEAGVPERVIMDIAGWKTQMLSQYRHKDSLKSAKAINEFFEKKDSASQRLASN